MLTNQEIYNKVRKHLLTQMKQCRAPHSTQCRYRGDDGLTCAIGCLIPLEAYDDEIEGATIAELSNAFNTNHTGGVATLYDILEQCVGDLDDQDRLKLLELLQDCHDDYSVDCWERRLNRIAAQCDLDVQC